MITPLPAHRPLGDPRFVEANGQPCAHFQLDPEGLVAGDLKMPMLAFLVYAHLDGKLDAAGVSEAVAKTTGGKLTLPLDIVGKIVEELDKHYLLQNERTQARRRAVKDDFAKAAIRPVKFVPVAEPALTSFIDEMYRLKGGPGEADRTKRDPRLRGLLAPHIDFTRGGAVYAHAYKQVIESEDVDTYVVLGVAHASPPSPFVPTAKAYATTLGDAAVDAEFVDALLKRSGRAFLDDEMAHLNEHSIEFQAIQLRHARRGRADFKIVPILCSLFRDPAETRVTDFIAALDEVIRTCGKSVCIVAGVDFAHIGPHFGDPELTDADVEAMCKQDEKSLAHVATVDAQAFWDSVMHDGNKRKVCGLTATYTALTLLKGAKGDLLSYSYAPDPSGGVVSFASAAFR